MLKKVLLFLGFFFISAIPAFACTITANPPSVPANTDTNVTFTVNNQGPVNNINYSLGAFPPGGIFASFTQPNWASSCINYTNNIGCNINSQNSTQTTYDIQTVVNISADQQVALSSDNSYCENTIYVTSDYPNPTPTPPPPPSCTVTANPSSIPANTNTNVTFTVDDTSYITNLNFSLGAFGPPGGIFASFTQPNWASSCINYTNNIGCYVPTLKQNTYTFQTVINIPSDYTMELASAGDTYCTVQLHTPPTISAITVSTNPVQTNTALTASANFTDPNITATHTASWNWGDGNVTTGTVTESNGSGLVSNSHTYTATGVYMITLSVINSNGGAGTSTYQYVSVYDTTTSFVGGSSFDNPLSAFPNTSGKVKFGISAKYNNGNVLTGSAKMNFKIANIDFSSTSLSSLATSNGKAYLKGNGMLNGNSGYTFLATGIDGSVTGGYDLIRFQIKDSSNTVIYDSQPGTGDTTDPTTVDATGNIKVN